MLKPRFWWKNGVGLGLTKDALEECNQRIRDYINMLLDYVDVPLQEYIYNVEIDKSDPGFSWAAPRKFIVTMEDLEFSDYKYNINADTNRAKAAELGAARSMKAAQGNFESVTGDEWTAQELYAQGIDKDKIPRLVKNGLIERTGRGRYRRISG